MLETVSLDDKYTQDSGRIFITGIQALVRLPMIQEERDRAIGLNTAGYITGYRGSPLGGYDLQLWQAQEHLEQHKIIFQPGINEDLAATAVWGTQQAELGDSGKYDGVFCIWYGKGPGVDRSGDAMRHANLAGTSKWGGVLAALGDDHACESSTTAHQSEYALVNTMMPILNPSGVQDILDFGLAGWALSRYSGCWVGLKCVHDTVEATASIEINSRESRIAVPEEFELPAGGVNIRWPDTPLEQEARLHEYKLPAVQAFWAANNYDRIVFDSSEAEFGIVTTGKSYSDVRRALNELRIDERQARRFGIRLYKIAMSWPLEREKLFRFAKNLKKIVVVEEKRGLVEDQMKTLLYGRLNCPVIVGKQNEFGETLFSAKGRLDAMQIASVIGEQILSTTHSDSLQERLGYVNRQINMATELAPIQRVPYFCAGCPHNSSTKVPEGSIALAGIGCHYMALWMDRSTERFTQMGGEGASWIGESLFSKREHVFQNIGDGTYLHSGLLAVRAAVASETNMTFKLLYNDAVAMTGGQPFDGPLSSSQIAKQLLAEGVRKVTLATDEPEKFREKNLLGNVDVVHRREMDLIQREFRNEPGVTAIIYDQTCAAEKRRRRKRGTFPDPPIRAFINTAVCEGCGDCGIQSNCVAVIPENTEFGRKRRIDQSACNKDYSCVEGFCPSFVTIHGGNLRKPVLVDTEAMFDSSELPEPQLPNIDQEYAIVVSGVGGTGVITSGAILGMAAHLSGLGCSILDMTGLAQKGGAVVTHIILAKKQEDITSMHVSTGSAALSIGGDLIVAASKHVQSSMRRDKTHAVVNDYEMMPGEFTRKKDLVFPHAKLTEAIREAAGSDNVTFLDANACTEVLFGDTMMVNMFLIGVAFQQGHIPVPLESIERAIELNGRSVELNLQALHRGRQYIAEPEKFSMAVHGSKNQEDSEKLKMHQTIEELISHRASMLVEYQDAKCARRYQQFVEAAKKAESEHAPGMSGFAEGVARYYYKLLAYKDEYEVARLLTSYEFHTQLGKQFEGDYSIRFHLAPPMLAKRNPVTGLPIKQEYGPKMMVVLKLLARMKFLRNTVLDPFARSEDRKLERQLIADYESVVTEVTKRLNAENHRVAVELACYPETIRGFGHVKRQSVTETQSRVEQLLSMVRDDESQPQAA